MKRLTLDAFYVAAGDAGARLLGFVVTVYLARILGTEYFGMIVIALSVMGYAIWFGDLGLCTLGTREMARPPEKQAAGFYDILYLKVLLALTTFVVAQIILTMLPLPATLTMVIRLYICFIFVDAIFLEWYFKGRRNYWPVTLFRWISGSLFALAIFVLVHSPQQINLVPISYLISHLLAALYLFYRRERTQRPPLSIDTIKKKFPILKMSLRIGSGGLFAQVVHWLPPLALAYFSSATDAGKLGAALRIALFVMFIDRIFVALFLPAISQSWVSNRDRIRRQLSWAIRLLLATAFTTATLLNIFSTTLLELIFTKAYGGGHYALEILSWFIVPTILNSIFGFGLIAIDREGDYFRATLAGSIIASILIIFGAAFYGINGTALGILSGEFIFALAAFRYFRHHIQPALLYPLLASAAVAIIFTAGAGYFQLGDNLWLIPPVAAGYLLTLLLTGVFTVKDVAKIWQQ